MLFSSTVFLFAFAPLVLSLNFLLPRTQFRNVLLLIASLIFYAWGEMAYVGLLLVSIVLNFSFGLWIDRSRESQRRHWVLWAAVAFNLALLSCFKYANFVVDNLNHLCSLFGLPPLSLAPVHLPIGISFFTFQALTYVVDVYRRDASVQHSLLRVALYISLFPQLIAGPIVRYRQVATELGERLATVEDIACGIRRFVIGLGKKVLIANTLAVPADQIFALPSSELQTSVAWLGVVCFALQIYFDFSGYSDMAIGLGRIFGFHFPENFNLPYVSRSIREYWSRWHMSLSAWFRDYVYIPLGGNQRGVVRTYANLFLVFFLCGLWHGASWNYVLWGMLHGVFMALERTWLGEQRERAWWPLQVLYTQAVLFAGWVLFRCDSIPESLDYFVAMLPGQGSHSPLHPAALVVDNQLWLVLVLAVFGSSAWLPRLLQRLRVTTPEPLFAAGRFVLLGTIFGLCTLSLAAGTHNPFIYFRF